MSFFDAHLLVRAEPDFVGSALVRESSGSKDGDDDKIYFFFSERALELDCDTELTVARVARVCKVMPQTMINSDQGLFNRDSHKTACSPRGSLLTVINLQSGCFRMKWGPRDARSWFCLHNSSMHEVSCFLQLFWQLFLGT